MSDKRKFHLGTARQYAEIIQTALAPFCERIIIAGSIRREKTMVSDIEVLYVSKTEIRPKPGDLFSSETVDLADIALDDMCRKGILCKRLNVKNQTTWGAQIKLASHFATGIPVDFFPTSISSWWNYLVCRTGPKESNVAVCMAAEKRGLKWKPYTAGFVDVASSEIIPMHSERAVFECVGLNYLEPKDRL